MIEYLCSCGQNSLFFETLDGKEGFCPSCKARITLHSNAIPRQRTKICEQCSRLISLWSEKCLYCEQSYPSSIEKTFSQKWVFWKKRL